MTGIMVALCIISGLEIFFNSLSKGIGAILGRLYRPFNINARVAVGFKLFWIAVFLITVIYFLSMGVQALATLFGIPLKGNMFDIFK